MCKHNKSIYGLMQASENWYDRPKTFLLDESVQQNKIVAKPIDSSFLNVPVWVDDIIVACSDLQQIKI